MRDEQIKENVTSTREKNIQTLTKDLEDWLQQHIDKEWKKPLSNIERGKFNRIKKIAKKEIQDLSLLALSLPENQARMLFSATELEPLIKALLTIRPNDDDSIVKNRRTWDLSMHLVREAEASAWRNIKALDEANILSSENKEFDRTRTLRTLNRFMSAPKKIDRS